MVRADGKEALSLVPFPKFRDRDGYAVVLMMLAYASSAQCGCDFGLNLSTATALYKKSLV